MSRGTFKRARDIRPGDGMMFLTSSIQIVETVETYRDARGNLKIRITGPMGVETIITPNGLVPVWIQDLYFAEKTHLIMTSVIHS